MENMKTKFINQRIVGGWLIVLSVTALALFRLQVWTSALGSPACTVDDAHIDSRLLGTGYYWWTTVVQVLLLLSLVLITLSSLVSLRLSRRSIVSNDPCSDVAQVPGVAKLNPLGEEDLLTNEEEIHNGRFQFQSIAPTSDGVNSK
jgi:hypothetical protein